MAAVATPMSTIVVINVRFRPIRSPTWPNSRPPSGRDANPTKNVANARIVPTKWLSDGKYSRPNTVLAAVL